MDHVVNYTLGGERPPEIKFPEIPAVNLPAIPQNFDLEKIIEMSGLKEYFRGFNTAGQMAATTFQDQVELAGEPKPFWWQINRKAKLEARSDMIYEKAKVVTEFAKGMEILNPNINYVVHPAFIGGATESRMRAEMISLMNLYLAKQREVFQNYVNYANGILNGYGSHMKLSYESIGKIYNHISKTYAEVASANKDSELYKLTRLKEHAISKTREGMNNTAEKNRQLAQDEVIKEDIKKFIDEEIKKQFYDLVSKKDH